MLLSAPNHDNFQQQQEADHFFRRLHQELYVGNVSTLAGVTGSYGWINGMGTNSKFNKPYGVTISPDGVYALVGEYGYSLIRKIILSTASVSTLAGVAGSSGSTNGIGTSARFYSPVGVSISPNGIYALVAEYSNYMIRHIILSTASVTTLAGVALTAGSTNGIGTNAKFSFPFGVTISPDGEYALVGDYYNHLIRRIILSTVSVSTLAGVNGSHWYTNGIGTNARFYRPTIISISPDGVYALVVDSYNHLIRRIILSTASVSTLAGVPFPGFTNGIGTVARFSSPGGISISPDGVYALVSDQGNNLIRQIFLATASVATFVGVNGTIGSANGIGTNARFYNPVGIFISPDGAYALVADSYNYLIRKVIVRSVTPSLPSVSPSTFPSPSPSSLPSASPSSLPFASPTSLPSIPRLILFDFGVKIGAGKAILVDYLRDAKRGKMLPISRIVNSSRVSSASDPPFSSDSILIKWRPVSVVSGIGSWEPSSSRSHTIFSIPAGGVLVSWLVSLLSDEIKGFIIKDPLSSSYRIHFIEYSNSSLSSFRRLSVSDPGISVSISPNKTLSARTLREYVPGVSDQRLYLLNSGMVR